MRHLRIFEYEVCRWKDFPECDRVFKEKIKMTLSQDYNEKIIFFKTFSEPYAYEIVMRLKDEQENLLSFYKSRFIIEGKSATVKKFTTRTKDVNVGENDVYLTYTGDYYPSSAETEDALIKISIESNNKLLMNESFLSSDVGNSPIKTDEIYTYKTKFFWICI